MSRIVIRLVSGGSRHRRAIRMAIIPNSETLLSITTISDAVIMLIEDTVLLPGDRITITEED